MVRGSGCRAPEVPQAVEPPRRVHDPSALRTPEPELPGQPRDRSRSPSGPEIELSFWVHLEDVPETRAALGGSGASGASRGLAQPSRGPTAPRFASRTPWRLERSGLREKPLSGHNFSNGVRGEPAGSSGPGAPRLASQAPVEVRSASDGVDPPWGAPACCGPVSRGRNTPCVRDPGPGGPGLGPNLEQADVWNRRSSCSFSMLEPQDVATMGFSADGLLLRCGAPTRLRRRLWGPDSPRRALTSPGPPREP